ncbi:hypothetical protein JQN32_26090, partial [Escherichia coli]|nr:hypothetical protein [Escherichia coli]
MNTTLCIWLPALQQDWNLTVIEKQDCVALEYSNVM